MANFIKLTRVYKLKGAKGLKTQTITVAVASIASVRASNRLGYPEHRSTITFTSGAAIDCANTFVDVNKMLGVR